MATEPQNASTEPNIDMQDLITEWGTAKKYVENYTREFPSLDNIVDGIPVTHEDGAPYVGDTTLAGLVRAIPRSSIQQLPIFGVRVNGSKETPRAHICNWVLRHCVFNEDTFGKGLLSTLQIGGEQALTHGYAPFMCATGSGANGDFGTTMRLLHYSDVAPEPGIQDHNETGFDFVAANLVKSRVQRIRDAAANNPNTTWNVEALDRLLEMEPVTKKYSVYQSSAKQQGSQDSSPTYEFVTRYEVGKNGQFITFCPQIEDVPLRVINNKSKFGYPRVQFLVIDPASLIPFGTSRVRLASPNQNLMNAYYQNIGSMLIYNSDPALLKRGRFTKPVQLKRKAVWETLDQNATVELKTMGMDALNTFVPMAKQMSAQIQNIMGVPQGNIGGDQNSMGYSKTAPGVKMQEKFTDTATNQVTNILENFLRQYALVALDTYIAEQQVDDYDSENPTTVDIVLDDEAKNAINRVAEAGFTPTDEEPVFEPPVGDDNVFKMDWNDFYDSIKNWSIEIELSIGKDELDEKQRADLQDMLTTLLQNNDGTDPEIQQRIRELLDMLMEKQTPALKRLNPRPAGEMVTPAQATPMPPATGGAPAAPAAPPAAPSTPPANY